MSEGEEIDKALSKDTDQCLMERPALMGRCCLCHTNNPNDTCIGMWGGRVEVGKQGFVDVLRPDAAGSKLVYPGALASRPIDPFSLSRHFSWFPSSSSSFHPPVWAKLRRSGRAERRRPDAAGRQETHERLELYQRNIDHEESAILLASCWIVKYLCKIAR